ncbi:MAG: flagellar biosynthetic protein FliR [Dehalococcoidia bacterium]
MTVFSSADIAVFALVLARVSGLTIVAPIFGARQAPAQSKIGLAVMVSLILTPLEIGRAAAIPPGAVAIGLLVGRETLVGLAVGFAISLIFTGIQLGSRLIGIQIGFGLGGVINPESGADSSAIDGFYSVLATLIFLTANGHHGVLAALVRTFDLAPLAAAEAPAVNPIQVMALVQSVFMIAIRIALPVIGAMLVADVAIGVAGRAAPQMQIMGSELPLKIVVGLAFLAISMPTTAMLMEAVYRNAGQRIAALLGG